MSKVAPGKVAEFGENGKSDKMISLAKNRHRGLVKTQNSRKMSRGVFWKVALLTNMASIAKMANSAKTCKRFSETSNVKS